MTSTPAAVLGVASLALCGCHQRQHITRANIAVVEQEFEQAQLAGRRGVRDAGVSVKEVESILGPPHRVDPPETSLRDVEVFRYYYHQASDTYELHFFDSKLIQMAKTDDEPLVNSTAKP